MQYVSEAVRLAYKHHINTTDAKPENFSRDFEFEGHKLVFMSEVDPHIDDWTQDNQIRWKIKFYAIAPNFVFIYRNNGVLHYVEPVLGQMYEFEFKKYHALLHKDNVHLFHKKKHWENWKPKKELACIFEFIDT